MEIGQFKVCSMASILETEEIRWHSSSPKIWSLENQESQEYHEAWGQSTGELPPVQGGWSFCYIQAFSWFDDAHPYYKGQPAYSEFTDLDVNFIQKYNASDLQVDTITIRPCYLVLIIFPTSPEWKNLWLFLFYSVPVSQPLGLPYCSLSVDGMLLLHNPSLCSQNT